MKGAREYAKLFKTGQISQFYIVSGRHARGYTFHVYVLPEGAEAKSNGPCNPPIGVDYVEVYGVVDGQPGWTESYGWLKDGPWVDDFNKLAESMRLSIEAHDQSLKDDCAEAHAKQKAKDKAILDAYKEQSF